MAATQKQSGRGFTRPLCIYATLRVLMRVGSSFRSGGGPRVGNTGRPGDLL